MFYKYLKEYFSERSLIFLKEINIFLDKNKHLRNYFYFFFFITLCGYASVIFYHNPHCDDNARYAFNYTCGFGGDGRPGPGLLEKIMYLSNFVFDAAPFTQILSCAIVSYVTLIVLKIFDEDNFLLKIKSKKSNYCFFLLCFVPVALNPYILEVFLFRFDNLFINVAYLCSTLAAYLSTKNNRGCLGFQILFLFYCLIFYQAAISAYCIIFIFKFLEEIICKNSIDRVIRKFSDWFATIFFTLILYLPLLLNLDTEVRNPDRCKYIIPYDFENLEIICKNFLDYLIEFKADWSETVVGIFIFALFLITLADCLIRACKKENLLKKIFNLFMVILLFFGLLVAIFGVNTFLPKSYYISFEKINPRTIYCIGIAISFLFFYNFKNFCILNSQKLLSTLYKIALFIFSLWNIVILNSFGNIFDKQYGFLNHIYYELGKDLNEIMQDSNEKELYLHFNGLPKVSSANLFLSEYPFFNKFFIKDWHFFITAQLIPYSPELYSQLSKSKVSYKLFFSNSLLFNPLEGIVYDQKYFSKKNLKQNFWYDISILDEKIIDVFFKHGFCNSQNTITKIK